MSFASPDPESCSSYGPAAGSRCAVPRHHLGDPWPSLRTVREAGHVDAARAVFDASAARYVELAGTELNPAIDGAVDRAMLAAFVELVQIGPAGFVADVGCGPGRAAAFVAARGLPVVGMDVSLELLTFARAAHPSIPFTEGRLDGLPFADGSLAGIVSWYSIIYTPPARLAAAFTEFGRALRPGGHLVLGFQCDDEPVHRPEAFGTPFALTTYRHAIDLVADRLVAAGFAVHATARREPVLAHDLTAQAFVIARSGPPFGTD